MTEQSENKANKITATDKSTPVHREQNETKHPKGELSEQQLEEATGGCTGKHIPTG